MAIYTDDQEKRIAELKKEVTKRGFDQHASVLKYISELPIELQSPVVTALAARESIQSIIAFPPQIHRGWYYVPKQALLFTSTDVVHVLASIWPGQEPQVTCLRGCGLMYMKITLLLLYGFLEIVAQGQGLPARVGMEFNTVAWHDLSPSLRKVLQAAKAMPGTLAGKRSGAAGAMDKASSSSVAQQTLAKLPLKFSNGVKIYGLLPGEELQGMVFQPGTWERWMYFFRRPLSANTLLLLTTNYMVVIQEEFEMDQGWILSYIPRASITGMQNHPRGLWNELSVQLKRGSQSADYKLMLESEAVETWRKQWIQHGGQWQDFPN